MCRVLLVPLDFSFFVFLIFNFASAGYLGGGKKKQNDLDYLNYLELTAR